MPNPTPRTWDLEGQQFVCQPGGRVHLEGNRLWRLAPKLEKLDPGDSLVKLGPAVTEARYTLGYFSYMSPWIAFCISHFSCITFVIFKQKQTNKQTNQPKNPQKCPMWCFSLFAIPLFSFTSLSTGVGFPAPPLPSKLCSKVTSLCWVLVYLSSL